MRWSDMEFLDSAKIDVIEKLENHIGCNLYVSDIGVKLTEYENANGSWYCSSYDAEKDVCAHFDLFGKLYDRLIDIGVEYNPFSDVESFHCAAMIELYRIIFDYAYSCLDRNDEKVVITEELVDEIRNVFVTENDEMFDWDEVL